MVQLLLLSWLGMFNASFRLHRGNFAFFCLRFLLLVWNRGRFVFNVLSCVRINRQPLHQWIFIHFDSFISIFVLISTSIIWCLWTILLLLLLTRIKKSKPLPFFFLTLCSLFSLLFYLERELLHENRFRMAVLFLTQFFEPLLRDRSLQFSWIYLRYRLFRVLLLWR